MVLRVSTLLYRKHCCALNNSNKYCFNSLNKLSFERKTARDCELVSCLIYYRLALFCLSSLFCSYFLQFLLLIWIFTNCVTSNFLRLFSWQVRKFAICCVVRENLDLAAVWDRASWCLPSWKGNTHARADFIIYFCSSKFPLSIRTMKFYIVHQYCRLSPGCWFFLGAHRG